MCMFPACCFRQRTCVAQDLMPDIFSGERIKLKTRRHTHTHIYIYTEMCIHIQKKEKHYLKIEKHAAPHTKFPKTHSHTHWEIKTLSETQNHSNANAHTHTHTHIYKLIKHQREVKVNQSKHTLGKRVNNPLYKPAWPTKGHSNWKQESSSLIEYSINKALCHICSLTKATNWKHTLI